MNDITPKEASEILRHYTDLGYGIVIEGDDISKIKQALSLASKMLANGTPIDKGDLIMFKLLMRTIADKGLPFEEVLLLIDNAKTPYNPSGDLISREALKSALEVTQYNDIDDLTRTERLIDNAQTAPPVDTRSQGKWITDERSYFYCDKCKQHPYNQYAMTNFCPNCGADMRGDKE